LSWSKILLSHSPLAPERRQLRSLGDQKHGDEGKADALHFTARWERPEAGGSPRARPEARTSLKSEHELLTELRKLTVTTPTATQTANRGKRPNRAGARAARFRAVAISKLTASGPVPSGGGVGRPPAGLRAKWAA